MLASINNVTISYGENVIIENASAAINEDDRIGIIGANGAGKTTLINALCKKLEAEDGEIRRKSGLIIGYLEQNSGLNRKSTIMKEMRSVFADVIDAINSLEEVSKMLEENPNDRAAAGKYNALMAKIEAKDGYNIDVKIKKILNGMGFSEKDGDMEIEPLSGGEKTRLAIARLLLEEPDILVLDEPTNHLDFKTLMWLEDYLSTYKGAVLIVSHDRFFLDKTVNRIWEIEDKTLETYKGNYTSYKEQKAKNIAYILKESEKQERKIEALEDYVAKNMVRASTSTRAKSKLKELEKIEVIKKPKLYDKKPSINFEAERRSVNDVLTVKDLCVSVGEEQKRLVSDCSFEVKRGEKIAIIGENGTGKSSLMAALYKEKNIEKGEVSWGKNVFIGYYEQENRDMNPENTAIEEIMERYPSLLQYDARNLLGRVLITGEEVFKKVGSLSGGERAKLGFAMLMAGKNNTLLLDEPTNHLDFITRESLEEALCKYEGTLIFVSHDRYFINKVCKRIFEIENGKINEYQGNFDYYLQEKANTAKDIAIVKEKKADKENMSAKQRRSIQAKQRQAVSAIEKQIKQKEDEIAALEKEIADNPTNYSLLDENCKKIEALKEENEILMEEWLEISE